MGRKRDNTGRVKDSLWQRFKSWRLGRKIRKGKLPRGRSHSEVIKAIRNTITSGEMGELWGILSARIIRASGEIIDLGVISTRKVTVAFRNYVVDSMQDSTTYPMDAFKYHGCGTDNTAEDNTDTDLGTEVGSRVAGTQIEGATADIYKTVATITPGGSYAIVEHGLFSASSSGVLADRSVFGAINVTASDSIEFTYQMTHNAEA